MLKSTHKPTAPVGGGPPLPPGWSVHTAPTGHPYYHNATTNQSTYTHPSILPSPGAPYTVQSFPQVSAGQTWSGGPPGLFAHAPFAQFHHAGRGRPQGGFHHDRRRGPHPQERWHRQQPRDRPKSKHSLPGHEPWILVRTKLGRQFVYNPDQGKSFWRIPDDLKEAVNKRVEEIKNDVQVAASTVDAGPLRSSEQDQRRVDDPAGAHTGSSAAPGRSIPDQDQEDHGTGDDQEAGSEEYEVETDATDDDETTPKRRRLAEGDNGMQPQEFNEDDIAYQLAAMGEGYEEPEWQEDGAEEEEPPLTEDDCRRLFKDLLDDHALNPYSTWEKIVEEGKIIDDERYVVLPNMKSRKEAWAEWSRDRIRVLKDQRATAEAKNPMLPYLAFLERHASVKLYWPEFKRKHKNAPEMRDVKLTDKIREKWYRDYVSRLKLPQSTLTADFTALLKSHSAAVLNSSSSLSTLPESLTTDMRFLIVPATTRDALLNTYIQTLPPPSASSPSATGQPHSRPHIDGDETTKQRDERERRRRALADRAERIAQEKERWDVKRRAEREKLSVEEEHVKRALRVSKDGLRRQLCDLGLGSTETEEEQAKDGQAKERQTRDE